MLHLTIAVAPLLDAGHLTIEQRERLCNVLIELQALLGASDNVVNTQAADTLAELAYTVAATTPPPSINHPDR